MRSRFVLLIGLMSLGGAQACFLAPALAADCSQGTAEEQIACLNRGLSELEAKVEALTKQMDTKASNDDALKWNDRVALRNEDMRIFPRCLDNPGPNSNNLTDVFANSCAKVPAQTWMLAKPYH
jgi:hypothetical protein